MSDIRKLSGIFFPVGTDGEAEREQLRALAAKKLGAPVRFFRIVKKSLDARDKSKIRWVYTIEFAAKPVPAPDVLGEKGTCKDGTPRVLVVGMGPAGLFCAVRLLQWGVRPVLIERGGPVEEREGDIKEFFDTGRLNVDSNIQFGEGGAGTFSDGKLNTQTNSAENAEVLRLFSAFGAPEEILYLNKPHIGSDRLKTVLKNMRAYILSHGGKIFFHTALTDVRIEGGALRSVTLSDGNRYFFDAVVLAIGHSARDTFALLQRQGVCLQQKEFAVGVRIEHLQEKIGFAQYGKSYALLPPADYKLVSHASERAAFTFCMCPGGFVMPSASEEGMVVTNGMSNYRRDGKNANSALIVQVKREDFGSDDPLAGIAFQRRLERAAYALGGGAYRAPAQRAEDFLLRRPSAAAGEVSPSYARGVTYTDLSSLFSADMGDALRAALRDMDGRLRGFAHPDALLTGVESRTSSPVRILRGDTGESVSAAGLYPCGEGAGYAGGITSAAADGLRTAAAILRKYGAVNFS